ncbi:hypothetical protein JOD29_000792 [Lysinibacillus composti]|uniref:Uncharacterized protein n=1 Tax=Lysinibacillus composti TaxID=720633 RepID=A0A3N9UVM7_9BACI|nr:hypothetical protein [Lysinibacillus composti]MBM7607548.1 hypothetical protein [Lysinibacillus composti]RQW75946.1 hypothetical protein EBB45_04835 [Lysinibacillus composti]
MNEEFIINMLILNQVNYQTYGEQQFYDSFELWMNKLQQHKNFSTLEDACNYYILLGEKEQVA